MKPHVEDDDLRAEYDFDFSKGERGRYYKRLLKEGSIIVVLEDRFDGQLHRSDTP